MAVQGETGFGLCWGLLGRANAFHLIRLAGPTTVDPLYFNFALCKAASAEVPSNARELAGCKHARRESLMSAGSATAVFAGVVASINSSS